MPNGALQTGQEHLSFKGCQVYFILIWAQILISVYTIEILFWEGLA